MFELIFGTIWMSISLLCTIIWFKTGDNELFWTIFFLIFVLVGLVFLIRGLLKLITNLKTDKKGEVCYGLIEEIIPSGNYVNDKPELKAKVLVYIESLGQTEEVEEIIGFDSHKYKVDLYVKVKYYDGDINFLDIVENYNELPEEAKHYLKNDYSNN